MLKTPPKAQGVFFHLKEMISGVADDRPPAAPGSGGAPAPARPHPADRLSVPVVEESREAAARAAVRQRGQFLARQDRWDSLLAQIAAADRDRVLAPGAVPEASLLAEGACADVVNAAEHALSEGAETQGRVMIDGIMALEAVRAAHRYDPFMAALVALAHAGVGRAWHGPGSGTAAPLRNRRRCAAHFDRAAALLAPHAELVRSSPFLAAAQCELLPARGESAEQITAACAGLIGLEPRNSRPMRRLGTLMLARGAGSCAALEIAARHTAAQTESVWGAGGYVWVYLDAIAIDGRARARVDARYFLAGLQDIVSTCPDQETVNLLAARCALAPQGGTGQRGQAEPPHRHIAEAAGWLIRNCLREIHPAVWAQAFEGSGNSIRTGAGHRAASRGRSHALSAIADVFQAEIARGDRIRFTAGGVDILPG